MKRSKAISAVAAVLAAGFLLASCTPFQSAKQKKWVDEMEDAFPEDTFEYVGHPSLSIVLFLKLVLNAFVKLNKS